MLYIKKIVKQDKEKEFAIQFGPSVDFFRKKPEHDSEDPSVTLEFCTNIDSRKEFNGQEIVVPFYFNEGKSEIRLRKPFKPFIFDKLKASLGDILVFKRLETTSKTYDKKIDRAVFELVKKTDPDYNLYNEIIEKSPSRHGAQGFACVQCAYNDLSVISNKGSISSQMIFYGAPGTGKSYSVEQITKNSKDHSIRTTFHPDSDYSSFVGTYKPSMITLPDGTQKIGYKYTPQAFLKAYTNAWKDLEHPYYLVIEEINRGNCAQIFGDMFQLLDRNANGFSSYSVDPDDDIRNHLEEEFKASTLTCSSLNQEILDSIKNGTKMMLPNNLSILATMNTSDQSLFPIDSAFKRRWSWKYVPISNANKAWKIAVNGKKYDWWTFLEKINEKIGTTTSSEDKKLGYFFTKADETTSEITAEQFVGKVIFYLWNDVFQDYGFNDPIFKIKTEKQQSQSEQQFTASTTNKENITLTFEMFFEPNGDVKEELLEKFLINLGLTADTASKDVNASAPNVAHGQPIPNADQSVDGLDDAAVDAAQPQNADVE